MNKLPFRSDLFIGLNKRFRETVLQIRKKGAGKGVESKVGCTLEDDRCIKSFERPCEDIPNRPKTGILFVHPGEASAGFGGIKGYLKRVSNDKTFRLAMPSINTKGCLRSVEDVCVQYKKIGGYSPLLKWANKLAALVEKSLTQDMRLFRPFKGVVGYRYAHPLVSKALKDFERDDIKHLVLFNLEPHYFCQRVGPCFDGIYRYYKRHKIPRWSWTVVENWSMSYLLAGLQAQLIRHEIFNLPRERRCNALVLFVANGVSQEDIHKGELYHFEVGITVHNVMRILNYDHDFVLTWLPAASCHPSLRPSLEEAMCRAYSDGTRTFIVVPVTYTLECLDTLYEIDIAILDNLRKLWGPDVCIIRTPAPNDHNALVSAISSIVKVALQDKSIRGTAKFVDMCHGCRMNSCKNTKQFFGKMLKCEH